MKFLQPSISGGELSPGMRGRVDLARYAISLGKCRNVITKPTGGAFKRPGTYMRGRVKFSDRATRLIPFVYSTDVKYLVEMGHNYFRFWVDGSLLTSPTFEVEAISSGNPAVVTATDHGLANGDWVVIHGARGLTRVNGCTFKVANATANTFQIEGFNSVGDDPYLGGGVAGKVVEVATPYTEAMIWDVRFTQSADVLYLVHGSVAPQELRRLAADRFRLRAFDFKRGPFRGFNTDESHMMVVSGSAGMVTVTSNVDTFTEDMVGSLIYIEEKELQGVKPWASGEKNVPVGATRRSDSKVYRAVQRAAGGAYNVAGGVRPVHDVGRAWDGPGDIKSDSVEDYSVGVLWEFLHNTFGILQITEFISETQVRAVVIERVPSSLVGSFADPEKEWKFSGNGSTTTFAINGRTSTSYLDYRVTINGAPQQSDPNYGGGGGVGGGGGGNPRPPGGGGGGGGGDQVQVQ